MTMYHETSVTIRKVDLTNIPSSNNIHTPQVGDDIIACVSGKYLCINAEARRIEPVPERLFTLAT